MRATQVPDCVGTSGKTLTNTAGTLTVGKDLSLGSAQSTAFGGPTASGTVARTTSTVNSVGLLNGLIKAGSVTAVAQETFKNGQFTGSAAGSGFTGLSVAGVPVPSITTANTKLTLPGFGYVIVNEESVSSPNSSGGTTAVNGLHVFVTQSNALGLPAGSQVIIAHAQATATRP
jgi:hypothetical protein